MKKMTYIIILLKTIIQLNFFKICKKKKFKKKIIKQFLNIEEEENNNIVLITHKKNLKMKIMEFIMEKTQIKNKLIIIFIVIIMKMKNYL